MQKKEKEMYAISNSKYYYYGYTVHRNGKIYSKRGKELKKNKYVVLTICGKKVKVNAAKLVYSLFVCPSQEKRVFIEYLDGNNENIEASNIRLINQTEYYTKKENCKKKFEEEQISRIKKEYGNPTEEQKCNQLNRVGLSYRQIAEKYNCSLSTIQKIMKGTY